MNKQSYYQANKEKILERQGLKAKTQESRDKRRQERKTLRDETKDIEKLFNEWDRLNPDTYSDKTLAIVAERDKANKYAPIQPIKLISDDFFDDLESEPTDEDLKRIEGGL